MNYQHNHERLTWNELTRTFRSSDKTHRQHIRTDNHCAAQFDKDDATNSASDALCVRNHTYTLMPAHLHLRCLSVAVVSSVVASVHSLLLSVSSLIIYCFNSSAACLKSALEVAAVIVSVRVHTRMCPLACAAANLSQMFHGVI
jgi:hypothetical protein